MINEKTIILWNDQAILGGDPQKIADKLIEGGFEGAILDSSSLSTWEKDTRSGVTNQNHRAELITVLKARGIHVYGSAAIYGKYPKWEGETAGKICVKYDLEAFMFDAESTFDGQETPDSNIVIVCNNFRKTAPGVKIGFCWWARWYSPSSGAIWHPKKVLWAAMEEGYGDADFGMPMIYWTGNDSADNAVQFAIDSFTQWAKITDKPMIPIGRAYAGDDGTATPEAITAFEAKIRELGAVGVSWWSMEHALKIDGIWESLVEMPKFSTETVTENSTENSTETEGLSDTDKLKILWDAHPTLHPTGETDGE